MPPMTGATFILRGVELLQCSHIIAISDQKFMCAEGHRIPPPLGHPCPFWSMVRVDPVMGDVAYVWRHFNLAVG